MIITLLLVFSVFLVLGVPTVFSMGIAVFPAIFFTRIPFNMIVQQVIMSCESFVLIAIPLFIFAGVVMDHSGITNNLVNLAKALIGYVRGGLGMSVIVGEMFFSGISGSTAADVSAIGSMLLPSLERASYPKKYSIALVSAASAMGILIPPCNMMVVLGALGGISVAALFLGGFLPATVMAAFIMALVYYDARRLNFPKEQTFGFREYLIIFIKSLIPLGMPAIIFGGILGGFFTPTEAAGVAVVYAVFVGLFIYRTITIKQIWDMAIETGVLTGMIMLLVGIAGTFSYLITVGGVTEFIDNLIVSISPSRWFFLVIVSFIFIFIGSVLEGIGALLIFTPVLMPLVEKLQVDPVHFGIVVMASIGIGLFLPPVGVGVLIACGIGGVRSSDMLKELGIFLFVLYMSLLVIIFLPWFSLVIPRLAGF
jgi:tripartite ATP-independent transporter DctM subunit